MITTTTSRTRPDFRNLRQVRQIIAERLVNSDDVIIRPFRLGIDGKTKVVIVYIDGMAERRAVDEDVVKPLMTGRPPVKRWRRAASIVLDHLIHVGQVQQSEELDVVLQHILSGDVALFIAGYRKAILLDLKGFPFRGAEKPISEFNIKGSYEGFSESMKTNVLLIRRRIQSPDLHVEFMTMGKISRNNVALLHIKGIANPAIVAELRRRLDRVDHEAVLQGAIIQSLITDNPWTPFPLYRDTERPDIVAQELLNGRLAIIVDNTPFAIIIPSVLFDFFKTTDDYSLGFLGGTFTRLVRLTANLLGLFLLPLYIAFLSFLPELLPTPLSMAILGSREGIPFPPLLEAVIMLVVVEILREASIRIPAAGPTLAIVGGLVLGTAAAEAQVVSVLMLIVVALTGLAHFVTPGVEISISIRLLLWAFLIAASTLGLIGLTLALVVFAAHLSSLRSLGIAYLSPLAPFSRSIWSDTIVRTPLFDIEQRPEYLHPLNKVKTRADKSTAEPPDIDRLADQAQQHPDDRERPQ